MGLVLLMRTQFLVALESCGTSQSSAIRELLPLLSEKCRDSRGCPQNYRIQAHLPTPAKLEIGTHTPRVLPSKFYEHFSLVEIHLQPELELGRSLGNVLFCFVFHFLTSAIPKAGKPGGREERRRDAENQSALSTTLYARLPHPDWPSSPLTGSHHSQEEV